METKIKRDIGLKTFHADLRFVNEVARSLLIDDNNELRHKGGNKANKKVNIFMNASGYLKMWFIGREHFVHNIHYVMAFGEIPIGDQVFHKDGERLNNHSENLSLLKNEVKARFGNIVDDDEVYTKALGNNPIIKQQDLEAENKTLREACNGYDKIARQTKNEVKALHKEIDRLNKKLKTARKRDNTLRARNAKLERRVDMNIKNNIQNLTT